MLMGHGEILTFGERKLQLAFESCMQEMSNLRDQRHFGTPPNKQRPLFAFLSIPSIGGSAKRSVEKVIVEVLIRNKIGSCRRGTPHKKFDSSRLS
jgi:hypothetical protein